ncbi:neurosecretory protein VGF [Protopterus annectens]|uniref:neurosecretory protein VGF n=1 Tax=Protopterus annectens TaxID=7888 RepID=UPI001CFB81E0|nr:neurosecretory protein VGF [Protopterus annectens]
MIWANYLQRTALLISISLLNVCYLHAAPLGEEKHPSAHSEEQQHKENAQTTHHEHNQEHVLENKNQSEKDKNQQARSVSSSFYINDMRSKEQEQKEDDDLFKDIDPKTLAAVLLQALNSDQDQDQSNLASDKRSNMDLFQKYGQNLPEMELQSKEDEDKITENVKSETRSTTVKTQNNHAPYDDNIRWEENTAGDNLNSQDLQNLKSMLQELQKYSAATKRERSNTVIGPVEKHTTNSNRDYEFNDNDILKELEAFEDLVGRKQKTSDVNENKDIRGSISEEKEEEKRVYFPEYEDEREIRRQTNSKKAEDEKIADIASDLLLRYLLKEDNEDQEDSNDIEDRVKDETKKNTYMFDDDNDNQLNDNAAEDKRSNEEVGGNDDDDDDDIDPQTIDKLIEISSKLHLPADDVIDIINDVEKKKKDSPDKIEPKHRQSSRDRVRAPPVREEPRPSYYYPHHQKIRSRHHANGELAYNDVLGNGFDYDDMPFSTPRRYRPKQNTFSNYIRPRTFQKPRQRYYQPHRPFVPREDYYDETQDSDEELENYIEKVLLKHPEVFQ